MRSAKVLGVVCGLTLAGPAWAEEGTDAAPKKPEAEAPAAEATPPEAGKTAAKKPADAVAKESAEAGTAAKPDTSAALDEAEAKAKSESAYGHGRQFGLRGGLVGGYRMVFRYDRSPLCNYLDETKSVKDQQKFCGHPSPLAAEVAISFAPIDSIEPFAFGRFGLGPEKKTDTDPVLIFGAGLRVYTMSDSAFKIFIEPALGVELEGGRGSTDFQVNDPEYKKDILFHLAAGPQYDFAKMIGLYLDAGITTGILRSIHSNLELQLGLQFRAP
ncbi:MAG: hypothetical protein HYZ29_16510 [Myxococcales bacterium]|nr:hypothetical protein [Myxococcales bacterium]